MKRKTYRTRRLVLRPLRLSDHRRWCAALDQSLPKQDKFDFDNSRPQPRLLSKFREAVRRQERLAERDESHIWNVFLRGSGELIGWMDVSTICRRDYQAANLGYFIFNHHRGRGYGVEAVRCLVQAAFTDLKYHRLEAAMDLDNRASRALAKAAGLYYEGVKKHYWFQHGRWEDQRMYVAVPELFR